MTTNQIEYWKLQESKRHNETMEAETQRHNVADEELRKYSSDLSYSVGMYQGGASYLSAAAQQQNADTNTVGLKLKVLQFGADLFTGGAEGLGSLLTAVGKIAG